MWWPTNLNSADPLRHVCFETVAHVVPGTGAKNFFPRSAAPNQDPVVAVTKTDD